MNFKGTMNPDISTQLPTWVVLELWEILNELNQDEKNTTEYINEDIEELTVILNQKVNAILRAAEYQKEHFGKSKYDL